MSLSFDNNDVVRSLPTADIVAPLGPKNVLTSQRSLPVKIPKQDADDFIIEVSAKDIKRVREKVIPYSKSKFSWSEILIGLGGVSLGATLGALSSQVSIQSFLGIIFYIICPVIFVGTVVRYFSESKIARLNTINLANEVLSELPNPEDAIEKEVS